MNNFSNMITESAYLLQKSKRQERQPLEALVAALMATLAFANVYSTLAFQLRYDNPVLAFILGPGILALVCLGLAAFARRQYRLNRPSRGLILAAFATALGTVAGSVLADRVWWKYTVSFYSYQDMASYVNVDPFSEKGQSFMDAGTIYFKEGSYVMSSQAVAFHNGATYCVAPIVRNPMQESDQASTDSEEPAGAAFQLPGAVDPASRSPLPSSESGTVDFWSVGTDCCGTNGRDATFTCGSGATSRIARSGMRILSTAQRSMFQLAVQEWSANTGLTAKHPIFVSWVKDPLQETNATLDKAWEEFWFDTFVFLLTSIILSFLAQMALMRLKVIARR